jgi:Right handed beta helix region
MTKIVLKIRKIALSLAIVVAALSPALYTAPAHAQVFHTWVSHSGSDSNSCVDTSPCLTFNGALAKTVSGGEISCLDSGSFGLLQITQSVTIDCEGTLAAPQGDTELFYTPVVINASGQVVTLRNLDVDGSSLTGESTLGVTIQAAAAVNIENCVIENWNGRGISDVRTSGATKLSIKNTIVRNNTGSGIAVAAAAHNSVVLDNVTSVGNAYGIAAATGNSVVVTRSVMSENSIAGVYADPGAIIAVDSSVISHNISYGVQANGTVLLANTEIMFNTSSISGATTSYGNNRIYGNGAGTMPTITAQQ